MVFSLPTPRSTYSPCLHLQLRLRPSSTPLWQSFLVWHRRYQWRQSIVEARAVLVHAAPFPLIFSTNSNSKSILDLELFYFKFVRFSIRPVKSFKPNSSFRTWPADSSPFPGPFQGLLESDSSLVRGISYLLSTSMHSVISLFFFV